MRFDEPFESNHENWSKYITEFHDTLLRRIAQQAYTLSYIEQDGAHEILSETTLQILARLDAYDPRRLTPPYHWVLGIARNKILCRRRSLSNRTKIEERLIPFEGETEIDAIDRRAMRGIDPLLQLREDFEEILPKLKQQSIGLLKQYLYGFSLKEIAKMRHCTYAAKRRCWDRLKKQMQKLRQKLER